jgi:hypothetical protein
VPPFLPIIQYLACVFALGMAYTIYVDFRRRRFGVTGFVFWEAVWVGLAVVVLVPDLFQPLSRALQLARLMDLVMVVAIVMLVALVYRGHVRLNELSSRLERLVREQALDDFGRTLESKEAKPEARKR